MATTQHYGFTLFTADDHPTWLSDWNTTMTNIDSAIYRISTGGGDLPDLSEIVARIQALEGRVDSDELRLNQVEGDVVDILDDLQTIQNDITTIESNMTTMQGNIDTLDYTVNNTMAGQITTISNNVSSINTTLANKTNGTGSFSVDQNGVLTYTYEE